MFEIHIRLLHHNLIIIIYVSFLVQNLIKRDNLFINYLRFMDFDNDRF